MADKRTYSLIVENKQWYPDLPINEFMEYMNYLHYDIPYTSGSRDRAIKILNEYVYSVEPIDKEIVASNWPDHGEVGNSRRLSKYRRLYNNEPKKYLKMRLATMMLYALCSVYDLIEIEQVGKYDY